MTRIPMVGLLLGFTGLVTGSAHAQVQPLAIYEKAGLSSPLEGNVWHADATGSCPVPVASLAQALKSPDYENSTGHIVIFHANVAYSGSLTTTFGIAAYDGVFGGTFSPKSVTFGVDDVSTASATVPVTMVAGEYQIFSANLSATAYYGVGPANSGTRPRTVCARATSYGTYPGGPTGTNSVFTVTFRVDYPL